MRELQYCNNDLMLDCLSHFFLPLSPAHLELQILVSLPVLFQLAPFDLAVRRVGAQLSQFGGEGSESSFVGSDLLLL